MHAEFWSEWWIKHRGICGVTQFCDSSRSDDGVDQEDHGDHDGLEVVRGIVKTSMTPFLAASIVFYATVIVLYGAELLISEDSDSPFSCPTLRRFMIGVIILDWFAIAFPLL
jgi:hypothetical protein